MAKKVAAASAKRSKSFRTPPPATYATAMDKLVKGFEWGGEVG